MVLDVIAETDNKEAQDNQRAQKHAAMQDLIRSSESHFLTIEHNGKSIRIRPAIPGKTRSQVVKLAAKYKGIDIEALKKGKGDLTIVPALQKDSEDNLYAVLASICLDKPYDDIENWRYFDEITGEAEHIFEKADAAIQEAHNTAISFRKDAGRTGTH